MVAVHVSNPSIREAKAGISEFKASLVHVMTSKTPRATHVYSMSSRTARARATQVSPVSRNHTTNKKLIWRLMW